MFRELPVLTTPPLEMGQVAAFVHAAIAGAVSRIELDRAPPGPGAYSIELHSPELLAPIVLVGETQGAITKGAKACLFRLEPQDDGHRSELVDFLAAVEKAGKPLDAALEARLKAFVMGAPSPLEMPTLQTLNLGVTTPIDIATLAVAQAPEENAPLSPPIAPEAELEARLKAFVSGAATPLDLQALPATPSPDSVDAMPYPTPARGPAHAVSQIGFDSDVTPEKLPVPPRLGPDALTPKEGRTLDAALRAQITPIAIPTARIEPALARIEPELADARPDSDSPVSSIVHLAVNQAVAAPPITSPPTDEPPESNREDLLGRVVGGKFKIESVLGAGGMGVVYRARHLSLDLPVAVKVLRGSKAREVTTRRFDREARAMSRVEHPNVLRILDFGEEGEGLRYIVTELVPGRDLATILHHERILATERIVDLMAQVCAALASAHDQGIIHRDVKPSNVLVVPRVDDEGRPMELVKVCDFGLAAIRTPRPATTPEGATPITAAGSMVGTPQYVAPELAIGQEADPRSDVYSCGVMLYEMATGRLPFEGENLMQLLVGHTNKEPPPPASLNPDIDRALEAVIWKALRKQRSQRHQNARALRAELLALAADKSARPVARTTRSQTMAAVRAAPPAGSNAPNAAPTMADLDTGLLKRAEALLAGAPADRESARNALVAAGDAGAEALCATREAGQADPMVRKRFVAAVKEIGAPALRVIGGRLDRLGSIAGNLDAAFVEDLLRAVPEVPDEATGASVQRFLWHRSPAIRRAAVTPLAALLGPMSHAPLVAALDDADDGVRVAALLGLKQAGGVHGEVVDHAAKLLADGSTASDDLRAVAAGALADAPPADRPRAIAALTGIVEPRDQGLLGRLRGSSAMPAAMVLETAARSLLAIGGPEGRRAVERRAQKSSGDVKRALQALLG